MKQYQFTIQTMTETGHRNGTVFCTAQNEGKARKAVDSAYGPQFYIVDTPVIEHPAHHFAAEIDATDPY